MSRSDKYYEGQCPDCISLLAKCPCCGESFCPDCGITEYEIEESLNEEDDEDVLED